MTFAAVRSKGVPVEAKPFQGSQRIPELDGIRGLAIGMVLLWHLYIVAMEVAPHTTLSYIQAAGRLAWSGVDLFFVLSGFLIGGILIDNRSATNYFAVFYRRRFFRIVPAYLFCVVSGYVLIQVVQRGMAPRLWFLGAFQTLPWTSYLFFLQNFWMAARSTGGILAATWSLAVEEQFYLTLPLIVRSVSPQRLVVLVFGVILAAPLFRIALIVLWPGHGWAGFALLPCRADALMLGVLGAIAMRNPGWKTRLEENRNTMLLLLGLLGAGLIGLTKYASDPYKPGIQTIGFTWIAAFYLCFLLYSLTNRHSLTSSLLRWRPLCWLGKVAYGAYLYHMFVAWIAFGLIYSDWPRIVGLRSLSVSIIAVSLTLVLCQISWKYFEGPLIKLGHRTDYEFSIVAKVAVVPIAEPEGGAR
jgi:peptidoglycan/LPS O-acetylase OafA/YrhL